MLTGGAHLRRRDGHRHAGQRFSSASRSGSSCRRTRRRASTAAAALPDEEPEEPAAVDRRCAHRDPGADRQAGSSPTKPPTVVARASLRCGRRCCRGRAAVVFCAGWVPVDAGQPAPPPTAAAAVRVSAAGRSLPRAHQPARRSRCHRMDDASRLWRARSGGAVAHLRQESRVATGDADCRNRGCANLSFSRPTESRSASSRGRRSRRSRWPAAAPVVVVEDLNLAQECTSGPPGITWGPNGMIVFPNNLGAGLSMVRDTGGKPEEFTTLDQAANEASHRLPHFLPDGSARPVHRASASRPSRRTGRGRRSG